jgi:hypothetical protein
LTRSQPTTRPPAASRRSCRRSTQTKHPRALDQGQVGKPALDRRHRPMVVPQHRPGRCTRGRASTPAEPTPRLQVAPWWTTEDNRIHHDLKAAPHLMIYVPDASARRLDNRRSLARSTPRNPPRTRAPLRLEVDAVARPGTLLPSSTNGSDPSPVSAAPNGAEPGIPAQPAFVPTRALGAIGGHEPVTHALRVASRSDRPRPPDGCCLGPIEGTFLQNPLGCSRPAGLAPPPWGAAWTPTRAARARVKGRRRRSRRDAKRP